MRVAAIKVVDPAAVVPKPTSQKTLTTPTLVTKVREILEDFFTHVTTTAE
jgi:hypothetical protein